MRTVLNISKHMAIELKNSRFCPGIRKLPFKRSLTILVIIGISELLIMSVLNVLPLQNDFLKGYLDTLLLLILLTPLLYLLVLKPMDNYIEDCRKAKEELYESEAHYRALTNSGDALIWKSGPDGSCTFVNQTWIKFTGRSLTQELGNGWINGVHPDDLKACLNDFMMAFELREKCSLKYRILHASGEYRWIQDNATPTYTSKGVFTGYIGHCLDIHENKMAEEFLMKREKEYHVLFECSPLATLFFDRHGIIIFWNKAAEMTLGWAKDETIGKNVTLFFKPDYQRPKVNYNVEKTLDSLSNEIITKEFSKKDGTSIICEWHRSPIYGLDGKTRKVILMVKDITEQKRLEKQLIAAKEKAEEQERLKSAFLANMSHELRSPLNSIIGFSELLADPDFDKDQKFQFAQLINNSGKHLLETITELMDYSKLDAGQMKVNLQPVSLNALLNELQLEYSFKATVKGVDLRLDTDNPKEEIVAHTDEIKLRQILVNFISNALKFTAKGCIEIGMRTTDSFVQLHVRDTGIGIPKEYQKMIFERFLQVESPDRSKFGGIGLGLAISKSLVELLGGSIWVESLEGAGSTFYFTLPLLDTTAQFVAPEIKNDRRPDVIQNCE